jgi:putative transposase
MGEHGKWRELSISSRRKNAMRRFELTDEQWERVKPFLPGQKGMPGHHAKDNRLFLEAVLWIARTGAPWRDLPERFGNWNSIFRRFNRWSKSGRWTQIFEALQDPDLKKVMLDSTIIRAHLHAAGASKKVVTRSSVGREVDWERRFISSVTELVVQ